MHKHTMPRTILRRYNKLVCPLPFSPFHPPLIITSSLPIPTNQTNPHSATNAQCFCFTSTRTLTSNAGFCGSNGICSELTSCATDEDCSAPSSSGNICAIKTCCAESSDELPGVCLQGLCGNPSRKLMVMAREVEWMARRRGVGRRGLTAAF